MDVQLSISTTFATFADSVRPQSTNSVLGLLDLPFFMNRHAVPLLHRADMYLQEIQQSTHTLLGGSPPFIVASNGESQTCSAKATTPASNSCKLKNHSHDRGDGCQTAVVLM